MRQNVVHRDTSRFCGTEQERLLSCVCGNVHGLCLNPQIDITSGENCSGE